MEKINIGKIVNVVGLKGEVKVYNYSDSVDAYVETPEVYVGDKLTKIEKVRLQKNMVVLKLEGINDRDAAEKARGKLIYITEEDLPELEEGEFYIRDLIGMAVFEENGNKIGEVSDVIQNSAQDIFEIETAENKKVLIPRVDEFILDIDADNREIKVRLIEGLLDL
jgi:16S rRNA processing protein RimM